MIESSTNAQIKKIQKLKKSARNRRKEGLFIAEGVRLVEDALAYRMVEKVYLSENVKEEYFDRLSHKLKEADIEYVSSKVFQEISDTESPQGVLAVVQMPGYNRSTIVEKRRCRGDLSGGYSRPRKFGDNIPNCRRRRNVSGHHVSRLCGSF